MTALLTLPQAALELFGSVRQARALRTEIEKGRLDASLIAGKLYVTREALEAMVTKCRAGPSRRASICTTANGSSATAPRSAERDAALIKLQLLASS